MGRRGCGPRTAPLWDVADPTRIRPIGRPLAGHTEAVMAVATTADGRVLATGSVDNMVRLRRMRPPRCRETGARREARAYRVMTAGSGRPPAPE
ncbi:WD40 repeat domain-containing protein [Frankia nepalensis]|uniref:WD40 repeat domain-containing protein n=1 Tax=Frankia nepalensis TaxID=1836974 RepID=UPI002B1BDAA7|nr:hypothetical protein [Frankia nepalensis]